MTIHHGTAEGSAGAGIAERPGKPLPSAPSPCLWASAECSSDHAVVWDAQGRGACGAHHRLLVIGAKP